VGGKGEQTVEKGQSQRVASEVQIEGEWVQGVQMGGCAGGG